MYNAQDLPKIQAVTLSILMSNFILPSQYKNEVFFGSVRYRQVQEKAQEVVRDDKRSNIPNDRRGCHDIIFIVIITILMTTHYTLRSPTWDEPIYRYISSKTER